MKTYYEYSPRGFANEYNIYYALSKHKETIKRIEEIIASKPCASFYRTRAKRAYKYERAHHHADYPLPCVTQLLRELLGHD